MERKVLKSEEQVTLYDNGDNTLSLYIEEQPVLENYPASMLFRPAIMKSYQNLVDIRKKENKQRN